MLYLCCVNRNSQQKLIKMPPREELRTRLGVIYFSMTINGKVHCFFEQSGIFKDQFRKLGYEAYDYDIQNNFGETDFVIDLFAEIEKAYIGGVSIFETADHADLIVAFFPCIHFCDAKTLFFKGEHISQKSWPLTKIMEKNIQLAKEREYFFEMLMKLVAVVSTNNLRLIIENPWNTSGGTYLQNNFIKPSVIDNNRMLRGDYFVKPTAYWFINCEPTHGFTMQRDKKQKVVMKCKDAPKAGICSEERSMISPDYARNFICDFIIGKCQTITQPSLFDNDSDLLLPDKI